jgi:integrase
LILTGQRLNDITKLSWFEIDFDKKLITIPAARMKSKRAHSIPLTPLALSILKSIPRQRGDFVFSTSNGRKPFAGWSKAKTTLDKKSGVTVGVLHDCRRSFRTRIAKYKVSETVKELCIRSHATYDQW